MVEFLEAVALRETYTAIGRLSTSGHQRSRDAPGCSSHSTHARTFATRTSARGLGGFVRRAQVFVCRCLRLCCCLLPPCCYAAARCNAAAAMMTAAFLLRCYYRLPSYRLPAAMLLPFAACCCYAAACCLPATLLLCCCYAAACLPDAIMLPATFLLSAAS